MHQIPKPERGTTEVLEPTIDRFSRPVRGSGVIKVREDVLSASVEGVREFAEFSEPGW